MFSQSRGSLPAALLQLVVPVFGEHIVGLPVSLSEEIVDEIVEMIVVSLDLQHLDGP